MKRFCILAIAAVMCCACNSDRKNVVKVYNWSSYIDESVIPEFEQWYEEQTGDPIKVIYQTFDINETMLSKIEKGHEDFDVVCPSDYIIERMINGGLLLPLDFKSLPEGKNYIKNNRSPYIQDMFLKINPDIDANDYSVAYMWGTTGILYNPKFVTEEEADSWGMLQDPKFAGKIFMKDAPRDVYGPVLMYLNQEKLENGEVTLDDLMLDSSDESIAAVEQFIKDCRDNIAGWEADFGKEQMTQERGWASLNWSGDAVWAIEEAAEIGVELRYKVPSGGSNVWFDGWVIPKYAKNVKAATYFIDFMCRPDIAVRNMDVTGYVSANGDVSVLESQIDESLEPIDVSYFFPGETSVRVSPALYPDKNLIERCSLLHDWGDDSSKLLEMWSRIKGDNANSMTFIILAATVVAIALIVIIRHRSISRRRRKYNRRRK